MPNALYIYTSDTATNIIGSTPINEKLDGANYDL